MSEEFYAKESRKPREKMKRKTKSPQKKPVRELATPSKGATLKLNGHSLVIPPGAVDKDQWFTLEEPPSDFIRVTITAEEMATYVFKGSKPVELTLSYADKENGKWKEVYIYETDLQGEPLPSAPPLGGSKNPPGMFTKKVQGHLRHLSGYIVSGGRAE
ncbi:hypothetical protein BH24GEM2_BH24GEM2_11450 [soil metagenome]|jgi:hypothetical protein